MAAQCKALFKTVLQKKNLPLSEEKKQECLDKLNKVPLNIAITGESGSGKSTLVNALRGIKNKTEGAAPTGVKETNKEPTEYIHPQSDKIRIWDLPGIGTTNFTADTYLEHVGLEKYDFFIIVSSDRFRENDAKLAQEIQKLKKKFCFVRSKIDKSINGKKDEENVLKLIRDTCAEELQKLYIESPKVFLMSGLRLGLYNFTDWWETVEEELPEHQSDPLLLALPNISLDLIEQKKKVLEKKIKWHTLRSSVGAAVPGLSEGVDLGLMVKFTERSQKSLGLSPDRLLQLSEDMAVPLEELRAELKSPLAAVEVTKELVQSVMTQSAAFSAGAAIKKGASLIPVLGTVVAVGVSGGTTHKALTHILDSLVEDAQGLFRKALGSNPSV